MAYGPKPKPRGIFQPDDIPPWNCMRCKQSLPVREYHEHPGAAYGFAKKCKPCTSSEARAARERRGVDYARNAKLQANYGITLEQLLELVESQGGCAICSSRDPGPRFWHVDHDHACCPEAGKSCGACVRGILCHHCNVALGQFNDDPGTLRRAAEYLEVRSGLVARATS